MSERPITTAMQISNTLMEELPDARPYLVGGCVRDHILSPRGFDSPNIKDIDMEVFGVSYEKLLTALQKHYEVDLVGKAFGVIKVKGTSVDISLPRVETCVGDNHKDFEVTVDPFLPLPDAAKRRDFTINAIYYDLNEFTIVDPYHGVEHLEARLIHPTSEKFEEDALRILRAMKFIARFDLIPSYELVSRCIGLARKLPLLPKERVQQEWKDFLLRGVHMSKGLDFLLHTGALRDYPELQDILFVPQHPEHHPEGNVWQHTKHCLNAFAASRTGVDENDLAVGFAVLGHDLGKAVATKVDDAGKITSHGHESDSVPLIRKFMERMYHPDNTLIPLVEKLVENHMRPVALFNTGGSISSLRRCSVAVDGRLDLLMRVVQCDQEGRPPKVPNMLAVDWVQKIVMEANLSISTKIQPIVMGRHLISVFQLNPGPDFAPILADAFQAQLDGKFSDLDGGLEYVKRKRTGS